MAERKLASIQRIVSLEPIKDADQILKAVVLGWELVVAKKDNLKVGDLVIYCEVDSILPDRKEFEFLRERKFRIKTIKLRGQISQGIAFPLSVLPEGNYKEGDNVTELLGVKKHDPEAELERKESERLSSINKNRMDKFLKHYAWYRKLIFKPTKKPFPAFIKKTDEDRIQLFPNACEQWKGIPFTVTEKLDGQSATYFCIPNPRKGLFQPKWIFGVCSRNFQLIKEDNSSYWTIAKQHNIKNKIIDCCAAKESGLVIQGEIIGKGIQGNKYHLTGYNINLFNAFCYIKGKSSQYTHDELYSLSIDLGLQTVPWRDSKYILPNTISEIVAYAEGNSTICNTLREGVVMRNYEKNISFKVINPKFLLKYDL